MVCLALSTMPGPQHVLSDLKLLSSCDGTREGTLPGVLGGLGVQNVGRPSS